MSMYSRSRSLSLSMWTAAALASAATAGSLAQSSGSTNPDERAAYVTANDVYVRCGEGDTYYPFVKLNVGDIVTVVKEEFGWSRVRTTGPAFDEAFGYVKAKEMRLSAGNRRGETLGRVEIIAPHMHRDWSPDASWKWIARVPAETELSVLEQVTGDKETFYKVLLPPVATGFVSSQFLRSATPEEVAAYTNPKVVPGEEKPATVQPDPNRPSDQPISAGPIVTPTTTTPVGITPEPALLPDANENKVQPDTAPTQTPPSTLPEVTNPAVPTDPTASAPTDNSANDESIAVEKQLADVTFDDIESAYENLLKLPTREAEFEPLRGRYAALLESGETDERQRVIAEARMQLLAARLKLQEQLLNFDKVRTRADLSRQDVAAARIAVERAADYTAVGRVAASSIYDGRRLPRLLRLSDPGTGRTLAYLQPESGMFDFAELVGQLVGVVGDKAYDDGLRLTVISPKRVDVLTSAGQ